MLENFRKMPLPLKVMTGCTIVPIVFVLNSLVPNASFVVLGRRMTSSEWWTSGAGFATLVVGTLAAFAAFLMLRRSRNGRLVYILAAAGSGVWAIVQPQNVGSPNAMPASISAVASCVLTALIAIYLYGSERVKAYFAGRSQ